MKKYVVLLFMTASILFAQPRWNDDTYDDDMGQIHGKRGELIDKLNLTEKQEDKMKDLRSEFQKKNIELRAKIQTMRITLRDEFDKDEPSQNKIESQMTEISRIQNEMKLNATSFWFDVNKMLTSEQQKIWKKHRQMMAKNFGERAKRMKRQFGMRHEECSDCKNGRGFGRREHGR